MAKRKKKATRPKKAARKTRASRARKVARPQKSARAKAPRGRKAPRPEIVRNPDAFSEAGRTGLGPDTGGQSGDIEGLHDVAIADSESVEELAEEGQSFEAEAIDAVENARDPDEGELKTREVPEDDVPKEYDDQ